MYCDMRRMVGCCEMKADEQVSVCSYLKRGLFSVHKHVPVQSSGKRNREGAAGKHGKASNKHPALKLQTVSAVETLLLWSASLQLFFFFSFF